MKRGKSPMLAQKKLLTNYRFDPDHWLVIRDDREMLIIEYDYPNVSLYDIIRRE
jgi:hypothetical protein